MYKKNKINLILVFLLSIFLSACSTFFPTPYPETKGTPKSYIIKGERYQPLSSSEGYYEEGIASWYGPGFHGKQTANGEIYNQHLYTAAHRILPLGTQIYVENIQTGEIIRVRINDRGPFADNRIIDLSRKAAISLGILEQGTAKVRLFDTKSTRKEKMSSPYNGPSYTANTTDASTNVSELPNISVLTGDGNVYIYCGEYDTQEEADKAIAYLKTLGLPQIVSRKGGNIYLETGPFPTTKDATNKLAVIKHRISSARVK